MDNTQTISLPTSLIEEAMAVTGKRSPRAALKALITLEHLPEQVRESERELRAGKGRRFSDARKALKWLES